MQDQTLLSGNHVAAPRDPSLTNEDLLALEKITDLQREALRLVHAGFSSKEIAIQVGRSPRAVDQRLDKARLTLGATTRIGAAKRLHHLDCASEGLTSVPFLLGETRAQRRSEQDEPDLYVFGDALTFPASQAWQRERTPARKAWRQFVPGLPSAESGVRDRIVWIVIMAIAILMFVVLGATAADSLKRLFDGS